MKKELIEVKGLDGKAAYFIERKVDQEPKDLKDTKISIIVHDRDPVRVVMIKDLMAALTKAAGGNINL